jgi:O-antigen/teichoic acid export membrane protein
MGIFGVHVRRLGFTVIKNALANIVRGGASGVVAVVLPHFLTRTLDHDRFAAWALMLQIAAFAAYLDFGVQFAVARYLAQAIELDDEKQRDRLISTAFAMLSIAGAIALLVIASVVLFLPRIFHGIPSALVGDLRLGLIFMAISAALGLPMSTFTGVLIGLHRNEFPAIAIGGTRLLSALAVLITVRYTHSLAWLALCLAVTNFMGWLIQYLIAKALLPGMRVALSRITMPMVRELANYCYALTVLSLAMLLVSGLDVTIVGHFNFDAVGYYAVAVTLIAFFVGLNTSVVSALMTPVAVLQARGELKRINDVLFLTTSLNTYANLLFTALAFLVGNVILKAWVGSTYEQRALPILEILMLGQAIRMIGNPYSTFLAATGQQKYAISGAIAEGLGNLICSLVGIVLLGPIGVAWGTLAGAIIGVIWMLLFTMRWARLIPIDRKAFIWTTAIKPIVFLSPVIFYVIVSQHRSASAVAVTACVLYAIVVATSQFRNLKTVSLPFEEQEITWHN